MTWRQEILGRSKGRNKKKKKENQQLLKKILGRKKEEKGKERKMENIENILGRR